MPDVNRLWTNLIVQRSVVGLIVLTLAVVNPVSCLIHCVMMDARLRAAQTAFFLCDHGEPVVVHAAHLPATPMPRAFYEVLPSVAAGVAPLLILVRLLTARPTLQPAFVRFQPPTPPPRSLRPAAL